MTDQRDAVDLAGAIRQAKYISDTWTHEVSGLDAILLNIARAVIALDEEVRRLRGERAASRVRRLCDECGDEVMCSIGTTCYGCNQRRGAVDRSNDQPAPSSPGASEPTDDEVETVAIVMHDAVEKAKRTFRRWDGMHETAQREQLVRAREAIRLGARVPR